MSLMDTHGRPSAASDGGSWPQAPAGVRGFRATRPARQAASAQRPQRPAAAPRPPLWPPQARPQPTLPPAEVATDAAHLAPPVAALRALTDPATLGRLLGPEADGVDAGLWHDVLFGPAGSFLANPGKGFRSRLVALGWTLGGGDFGACPRALQVCVEWLHAGSLIVDDIEDGADTRRGRPALHRSHGLPKALNTGNWMYFAALQQLADLDIADDVRAALVGDATLAVLRCHHGQALDIGARVDQLPRGQVTGVVKATTALKTGALMALAGRLGARAALAPPRVVDALGRFGLALGTGLQMLDDLGSVLSEGRQHKLVEDLRGGHPTWAWAWLSEKCDDQDWTQLTAQLRQVQAGGHPEALARQLRERLLDGGLIEVERHLALAFEDLRAAIGNHPALARVEREIARLKVGYA